MVYQNLKSGVRGWPLKPSFICFIGWVMVLKPKLKRITKKLKSYLGSKPGPIAISFKSQELVDVVSHLQHYPVRSDVSSIGK
jgi:hypothetical protein